MICRMPPVQRHCHVLPQQSQICFDGDVLIERLLAAPGPEVIRKVPADAAGREEQAPLLIHGSTVMKYSQKLFPIMSHNCTILL